MLLQAALAAADTLMDDPADVTFLPESASALLGLASDWHRRISKGERFDGMALDAQGSAHNGTFALVGPIACFASPDGTQGLVLPRAGSAHPGLHVPEDPAARSGIQALVTGGRGVIPVDVTTGEALKVRSSRETLGQHLRKGGLVMIPLLLIGALSLALAVVKFASLQRLVVRPGPGVAAILAAVEAGETDRALAAAKALRAPLGPILAEAIEHRDAPREHLEEILYERIQMLVPSFERHLGTLAVFGGVAPLLGLLGTVTGMIHTFRLVTLFGTGEAKLLSGGISEALITTECGLVIAVPVLIVHAYLSRRVRTSIADLESTVASFVVQLKRERPG
jgi:biopolymer transport protein ExbB